MVAAVLLTENMESQTTHTGIGTLSPGALAEPAHMADADVNQTPCGPCALVLAWPRAEVGRGWERVAEPVKGLGGFVDSHISA